MHLAMPTIWPYGVWWVESGAAGLQLPALPYHHSSLLLPVVRACRRGRVPAFLCRTFPVPQPKHHAHLFRAHAEKALLLPFYMPFPSPYVPHTLPLPCPILPTFLPLPQRASCNNTPFYPTIYLPRTGWLDWFIGRDWIAPCMVLLYSTTYHIYGRFVD